MTDKEKDEVFSAQIFAENIQTWARGEKHRQEQGQLNSNQQGLKKP